MPPDFEKERQTFREYYNDHHELLREASIFFQSLVTAVLRESNIETDAVTSRVKEREECITKFSRKYRDKLEADGTSYAIKEWISDLIGVRVVCLYEPDVYAVEKILKKNFEVLHETDRQKALEELESSFGYKGVHLDLKLGSGRDTILEYRRYQPLPFEVQIRTISQDAWSTLDHKMKYKKNIPVEMKRAINRLAALFELADQEFVRIRDSVKDKLATGELLASNSESMTDVPLDVFGFLGVVKPHFPNYPFLEDKSDGFLQEILAIEPKLQTSTFAAALNTLSIVDNYRSTVQFNMNPFTQIRHALFASNRSFAPLLFNTQQAGFETWLRENNNPTTR